MIKLRFALKSTLSIFLSVVMLFYASLVPVYALTEEQRKSLETPFYQEGSGLCDASVSTTLSGSDNIARIYNYLIGKPVGGQPLKDFQVAGIMGNMQHESGYQPQRLQGTSSGTVTQAEVVPRGQTAKAYGLVQWDPAHKMIDPVVAAGKNANDMQAQLDFLLEQLNGGTTSPEKRAGDLLAVTTNVAEATLIFETKYERHRGGPQPTRIVEAERILGLVTAGGLGTTTASAADAPAVSGGKIIALDPGHGGAVAQYNDPITQLPDRETTNAQETADAQNVADRVKTDLEAVGYRVLMLKQTNDQAVSKRTRVDAATAARASLAISIHTTPPTSFNQVWPQFVGGFRATRDDSIRVEFENQAIANESNRIAGIMAVEREKAEGRPVTKVVGQPESFSKDRPGLPAYGNLSLVQLWSKDVPWVYNEFGTNGALTEQEKTKYAAGIATAVKLAVPLIGGEQATNSCATVSATGDLSGTVLSYAWPDYRGSGYTTNKPEYEAASTTARSAGQYIGGIRYPAVDCGGFTTRVMINSGFEPRYNYGASIKNGAGYTAIQLSWVRANWQLVGRGNQLSTADLRQGDVAFRVNSDGSNDGHTFMFAGDIPGFGSKIASASLDDRAPMAGKENALGANIEWYRKK